MKCLNPKLSDSLIGRSGSIFYRFQQDIPFPNNWELYTIVLKQNDPSFNCEPGPFLCLRGSFMLALRSLSFQHLNCN